MKKYLALLFMLVFIVSCSIFSRKNHHKTVPLFEVLTQQPDGGGNAHFYEIVSDSIEFPMLAHDKNLRHKIKPNDIKTSNFVILNMGEKISKNCTFEVVSVEETTDKIIISIKENDPFEGKGMTVKTMAELSYPYMILKINSKKEIVLK